jgi:hypothetical protein
MRRVATLTSVLALGAAEAAFARYAGGPPPIDPQYSGDFLDIEELRLVDVQPSMLEPGQRATATVLILPRMPGWGWVTDREAFARGDGVKLQLRLDAAAAKIEGATETFVDGGQRFHRRVKITFVVDRPTSQAGVWPVFGSTPHMLRASLGEEHLFGRNPPADTPIEVRVASARLPTVTSWLSLAAAFTAALAGVAFVCTRYRIVRRDRSVV